MKYFGLMIESKFFLPCVDDMFSKEGTNVMPFIYNTYPRIINRYVKKKRTITLKEAIERFTCNAAERIGIKDRGYLRKGCFAGIIVFDYNNFMEHPFEELTVPKHAESISYLLINGRLSIENGINNKILAGAIIKNI